MALPTLNNQDVIFI